MKSNFEEAKEQMIEFINDETRFKQTCFSSALELEKCIQECEESVKKTQECAQGLEKCIQECEESVKKTQECAQEFEKWIQTGEDLIKGEDFIEVEPEEE